MSTCERFLTKEVKLEWTSLKYPPEIKLELPVKICMYMIKFSVLTCKISKFIVSENLVGGMFVIPCKNIYSWTGHSRA